MHHSPISTRSGEAAPSPFPWEHAAPAIVALEAHASAGCSVCARTLGNSREIAVALALAQTPVAPRPRARRRLLDRTRSMLAAPRANAVEPVPS